MNFPTLIILLSFALCSSAVPFNHTLGPLALCNSSPIESRSLVENCFQRCVRPHTPRSHGALRIYSEATGLSGPKVILCFKVQIKQTFIETWSLSQIAGIPVITKIPVSQEECISHIQSKCPSKECTIHPPSELTPEYHYASDTTKTEEYLGLISMPSSFDYIKEQIRVNPMGSKQTFDLSKGMGSEDGQLYFWEVDEVKGCPFELSSEVGCDYYDGDVDSYVCRHSRIVIDEISKSQPLSGVCSHLSRSMGGLLYSWSEGQMKTDRDFKKMTIVGGLADNPEITSVKLQASEALSALDEDICQIQCEILDMVSHLHLGTESLSRLGNKYYLLSKTGFFRECQPLSTCKLIQPHIYCGNPLRIGISCNGKQYMWNPMKSYIDEFLTCHAVTYKGKFSIHVGAHLYDIDNNISINISKEDSIGLSHDLLSIKGSSLKAYTLDTEDFRRTWMQTIDKHNSSLTVLDQSSRMIDHWDILQSISSNWSELWRILTDVTNKIGSFALIVLGCILSVALLMLFTKKKNETNIASAVRFTSIPSSEESPRWM